MSHKYPFLEILSHLGADADQVVLVGGWVPTVYFDYVWPSSYPLVTKDIDFGVPRAAVLERPLETYLPQGAFRHRHLKLGKVRPYQLIYKDYPIDFLADEAAVATVREKVLGYNVLINSNRNYSYVLADSMQTVCDGIPVRVPHPARYITHKVQIYLHSYKDRFRDLASAYYCLTKEPIQGLLQEYAPRIIDSEAVQDIRKLLPTLMQTKEGLAIQDVQKTFAQFAYYEEAEDILGVLKWLVRLLKA